MEKGLISVIVPVYKVESYLSKCIESIINQSYTKLEIILINDGSPDESGNICDKYAKKDTRIKVLHKVNAGVSEARNDGLKLAKGEYIAFIDSDDFIEEDYFDVLLSNLGSSDIISCNVNFCYADDKQKSRFDIQKDIQKEEKIINEKEEVFKDCFNREFYTFVVWAKLYRRSVLEGLFFENQAYGEDSLFIREVFCRCTKIKIITYTGYNYYIGNQGATSNKAKIFEMMYGALKVFIKTRNMCKVRNLNLPYDKIESAIDDKLFGTLKVVIKHNTKIDRSCYNQLCHASKITNNFDNHSNFRRFFNTMALIFIRIFRCKKL